MTSNPVSLPPTVLIQNADVMVATKYATVGGLLVCKKTVQLDVEKTLM